MVSGIKHLQTTVLLNLKIMATDNADAILRSFNL